MNQELFKHDVPNMPEGYYSGDKPNPNLKAFVEVHLKERPYNIEDDKYRIDAFSEPINAEREHDIFNMHAYWSKKAHEAIRAYIEHFTRPSDLVLDQFCGSGGTALSAILLGRKTIAIDRSPAATFITNGFCSSTDLSKLNKEYERVLEQVGSKISDLYKTSCHICDKDATIHYQVYSMTFQCLKCLKKQPIARCDSVDSSSNAYSCPYCHNVIKTSQDKLGYQLIETWVYCSKGCSGRRSIARRFDDDNSAYRDKFYSLDIEQLKALELVKIPDWAPRQSFPEKTRSHTLRSRGVNNMRDLYTHRNLLALCLLWDTISEINEEQLRRKLQFIFTAICLKTSKMMGYNADKIGRIRKDSLQAQFTFKDVNVLDFFTESYSDIFRGFAIINKRLQSRPEICISTQSATDLSMIPANSIDYIFTDPPYGDKIQFWEMNQIWENWLGCNSSWEHAEIIVCNARGITEDMWQEKMSTVFHEAYRVLKPGRWITLTYHDISTGTWHLIQDAASGAGFVPDTSKRAIFIETRQKAEKQYKLDININKRDLIINFRKPKYGEASASVSILGTEDNATFNEKVRAIIVAHLCSHPGATRDWIYDEVVSHMVRAGRMEAHDFEGLLRQVADEVKEPVKRTLFANEDPNIFGTHEISRWYLKDTEFTETDAAESAKEDSAAEKVEAFIAKKIKEHPEFDGVHYSDIFEQYIYSVKDKPRRQLAEWLLDYFYKTDTGTYRLPQSDEEKKLKAVGRAKGTHRRVKRFLSYLQQGVAIPPKEQPNDATLAEWLRYCKRSGLYEQGKLLYEKGGLNLENLSEEAMVNAEEDYQVCGRLLARGTASSGNESTPKRARKAK